jgi:16S rRNA processing protein RimM
VGQGSAHPHRPETEQTRGSGAQGRAPEPRYLAVGRIVGVHGVRGEVRAQILTQDPHRFRLLKQVFLGLEDQEPVPWRLEGYRLHKGQVLLKLKGCEDRNTAETFRWQLVQVPLAEALPLNEDEVYEYQLLGLSVWTQDGEPLGTIEEIIETGANDVLVLSSPERGEILVPATDDVIQQVDLDAGRMVVALPDGLL